MTTTLPRAAVDAWTRLMRAEQALVDKVEDDLKRAGFPSLTWYDVLLELDRAPDGHLPQQDVQGRVMLAQYNLCRLADRLEAEHLIERRRCPVDGRNRHLVITRKGRELRAAMWPVYAASIQRHVAQRLTQEEARQLAGLLTKLMEPDPNSDA
jgi:DNA-binding MarR family transcriptional regulator